MAEVRLCAFGIPALLALVLMPAVSAAQLVERVVDGDTIVVRGVGRVRLIGVDTPETVDPRRPVEFFGREASAFTKRLLEGQRVRLEYDWERADRYGRTLAYVYLRDGMLGERRDHPAGLRSRLYPIPLPPPRSFPRSRARGAGGRPRVVGAAGGAPVAGSHSAPWRTDGCGGRVAVGR